jgi:SAM-dependent methyltransferase
MKARESGMPDEDYWSSFFDADCIVAKMECAFRGDEHIAEFGSGYGTFTLPAARRTRGIVHAIDIEPEMIGLLERKAEAEGIRNIRVSRRDFVEQGSGLRTGSLDHVILFNILHLEDPVGLLREGLRILKPGATASVIHWKHDPSTPRGPSMDVRPRPDDCRAWAEAAGFEFVRHQDLAECCNYHYGLILKSGQ